MSNDPDALVMHIVQAGHAALRQAARPLTVEELQSEELQTLIRRMQATMRAAPGVGLAAPQVGASLRLAVVEDRPEYVARLPEADRLLRERTAVPYQVLVNPVLTVEDPTPVTFLEGCLSVTGWVAEVTRARGVRVEALDELGQPILIRAVGWHARILQHECDHLDGTLYVDKMHSRTLKATH